MAANVLGLHSVVQLVMSEHVGAEKSMRPISKGSTADSSWTTSGQQEKQQD